MSAQTETDVGELQRLPIDQIDANPKNPRLEFPAEELDKLSTSIDNEGILVPVVVYLNDEGRFTLIDGERRYRCARDLGHDEVPAVVRTEQSEIEHLVSMFNIHHMRESWQDIPTAKALAQVVAHISESESRDPTDTELADITGLSRERIQRFRFAVTLPEEYQEYIRTGEIPLNWFWELNRSVIQPLARRRRHLMDALGRDAVTKAYVNKRRNGVITSAVTLRRVASIIDYAERDAGESGNHSSVLDDTLKALVEDEDLTVEQAYQDTIQMMVETETLARNARNLVSGVRRLLNRVQSDDERAAVVEIARDLHHQLDQIIPAA